MECIEKIELEHGITVAIHPMDYLEDPRKDYDHIGVMLCAHDRYTLGDEQVESEYDAQCRMLSNANVTPVCDKCGGELEASYYEWVHTDEEQDDKCEYSNGEAQPDLSGFVILPLYLYDHSGLTMSTSAFSCPWDSGQVGVIYMDLAKIVEHWGEVEDPIKTATDCLVSEVKEYDQYLTGDVYGYIIEDEDGEDLDSCWGFYGFDYAKQEALDAAKHHVEEAAKAKQNISERLAEIERIGQ
jgi:hypothetical protein